MMFVADEMLGKLARWMRVLGYDTIYRIDIGDNNLVSLALQERRIILTRDTRMVACRYMPRYVLVKSDEYKEQLHEVITVLALIPDPVLFFSRCLLCNTRIEPVDKKSIALKVPPYVYDNHEHFYYCPRCNKVYWQGTHIEHIRKTLKEMLG